MKRLSRYQYTTRWCHHLVHLQCGHQKPYHIKFLVSCPQRAYLIEVRLFPLTLVLIVQFTINKKEVDSKMKLNDERMYKSFGVFIKSWTIIHGFPRSMMEIPPCGEAPKSEVKSSVQAETLDREIMIPLAQLIKAKIWVNVRT